MQSFLTIVFATVAVLSPLVQGRVTPPEARAITGKMEWQGMSNGQNVTLYGHASEIKSQLMAADASWVPANQNSSTSLTERAKGGTLCCPVRGQSWSPVSIDFIQEAMDQLNEIGGACTQGAGPGHCSILSENGVAACVFGAGVHLCNDDGKAVSMPCSAIATYANDLIDSCHGSAGKTCGQIFETGLWNIYFASC